MTRRVLVSQRLPTLRSGNAELDRWVEQHLQRWSLEVFEQLKFLTPEEGLFTPTVSGSGTAGTYELAANNSRYYRAADLVFVHVDVTFDNPLTAGGTDAMRISGMPFKAIDSHSPMGAAWASGVDHAGNYMVSGIIEDTTTMNFNEIVDGGAAAEFPISAIAADDRVIASLVYVTDGQRS